MLLSLFFILNRYKLNFKLKKTSFCKFFNDKNEFILKLSFLNNQKMTLCEPYFCNFHNFLIFYH
jgi:hypothetical protein